MKMKYFILFSFLFLLAKGLEGEEPTLFFVKVPIDKYFNQKLTNSRAAFQLTIPEFSEGKIGLEISQSHPSKFAITLNTYNQENQPDYTKNETGLITSDELNNGKNIIILNIKEAKSIALIFNPKKADDKTSYFCKIKYKIIQTGTDYFYLSNPKINVVKNKPMLDINWEPIMETKDDDNSFDFEIQYKLFIFDKKTYDSKFENSKSIFTYDEMTNIELSPLVTSTFSMKGKYSGQTNYLRLNATENNLEYQYLIIVAIASNANTTEYLTYDRYSFSFGKETPSNSKNEEDDDSSFPILWVILIAVIVLAVIAVIIIICLNKKSSNRVSSADVEGVAAITDE